MPNGEPPPMLEDTALAAALDRVAQVLRAFGAALEGRPIDAAASAPPPVSGDGEAIDWLALAGNAYLYPDVVLGAVAAFTAPR